MDDPCSPPSAAVSLPFPVSDMNGKLTQATFIHRPGCWPESQDHWGCILPEDEMYLYHPYLGIMHEDISQHGFLGVQVLEASAWGSFLSPFLVRLGFHTLLPRLKEV